MLCVSIPAGAERVNGGALNVKEISKGLDRVVRQVQNEMSPLRSVTAREEKAMRKLSPSLAVVVLVLVLLSSPLLVWADEGLAAPEALQKNVSLEGLTGISLFFARAYQTNDWLYALYCTLTMAVLGTGIAFVTDFLLAAVGLEVQKIEHRE
jgi:ABC-type phosphate/phosphonate transport system permease subunit